MAAVPAWAPSAGPDPVSVAAAAVTAATTRYRRIALTFLPSPPDQTDSLLAPGTARHTRPPRPRQEPQPRARPPRWQRCSPWSRARTWQRQRQCPARQPATIPRRRTRRNRDTDTHDRVSRDILRQDRLPHPAPRRLALPHRHWPGAGNQPPAVAGPSSATMVTARPPRANAPTFRPQPTADGLPTIGFRLNVYPIWWHPGTTARQHGCVRHRVVESQARSSWRASTVRSGSCDRSEAEPGPPPTPSATPATSWSSGSGPARNGSRPTGRRWPSPRPSCRCPGCSKSATPSTARTPSQSAITGSTSKMSVLISQTPQAQCWRPCSPRCSRCRRVRTCRLAGTGDRVVAACPGEAGSRSGWPMTRRSQCMAGEQPSARRARSTDLPGRRSTRPRPGRSLPRAARPGPRGPAPRQRAGGRRRQPSERGLLLEVLAAR